MAARSSSTALFRSSQKRMGPTFPVAIGRMRDEALLRLEFDQSRPAWMLGGEAVSAEVVTMLIATKEIEADPDALFPGAPAQVWRVRKA